MKKFGVIFFAGLVLLQLCCQRQTPAYQDVTPQEAASLIRSLGAHLTILDIRTAAEFERGHIPGAINRDFFSEDFQQNLEKLDRDQPLLLHCQSGGRSQKALILLLDLGFKKIYHLNQGYLSWEAAGMAVEPR